MRITTCSISVSLAQLDPGLVDRILCPPHPASSPDVNSAAPAAAPAFSSWRREIGLNGMNALLSPMASMRVFDLAIASLPKPPEATVRPLRLLRNDSSFVSMQLLFWAVPPRDDRDRDGKINGRSGRQIDGEDRPAGSIDPRSETQFAAI